MSNTIAGQPAAVRYFFEPLPALYGGLVQNEAELAKC
jgi:hypothetical protein